MFTPRGPQFEMPLRPPGIPYGAAILDATAALLAMEGQLVATWGYAYLLSDRIYWVPAEKGILTSPGEVLFGDVLEVEARDFSRMSRESAYGVDLKTEDHEFSFQGMDDVRARDWASHVHAHASNLVPPGTARSKRRFAALMSRRSIPVYALLAFFVLLRGAIAVDRTDWWDSGDIWLLFIAGAALLGAFWIWTHPSESA